MVRTGLNLSAAPLSTLSLVSLDTETTGLDTATDRVIEIGAVKPGERGESEALFSKLVNPGQPIPPASTAIHGITDQDVDGAEDFGKVYRDFATFAEGKPLIGFSLAFDLAILAAEHKRRGLVWTPPRFLDVRHLVQLVLPQLTEISLEACGRALGVAIESRHRALGDAKITAALFKALIPLLAKQDIITLAQAERAVRPIISVTEHNLLSDSESRAQSRADRANRAIYARIDSFAYRTRVSDIMTEPPRGVHADQTLKEALHMMVSEGISSVFVSYDKKDNFDALITERGILRALDLHGAEALSHKVGAIGQRPLVTITKTALLDRAIALMSARKLRHLSVVDEKGELCGILSQRDLLKQRANESLLLTDDIASARSLDDLTKVWASLTTVVGALNHEQVDVRMIADIISRELRGLTRRASELATTELLEEGLGSAPADHAVIVLGSGGRGESLLAMDQDNALVIADTTQDKPSSDAWFAAIGQKIADGLNQIGVRYCPGGIMTSNADWRHDVSGWKAIVGGWIRRAQGEDILNSDIFFDARTVFGNSALVDDLLHDARHEARHSVTFIQRLSMQASSFHSPLGLFNRFKMDKGRIDLKAGGIMPIFAAARVVSIQHDLKAHATRERLEAFKTLDIVSESVINDLVEAHRLLLNQILQQQLRDLEEGEPFSNKVAPRELDGHEQQELIWALEQVSKVKDLLGTQLFV